jgi:hypothetical protein
MTCAASDKHSSASHYDGATRCIHIQRVRAGEKSRKTTVAKSVSGSRVLLLRLVAVANRAAPLCRFRHEPRRTSSGVLLGWSRAGKDSMEESEGEVAVCRERRREVAGSR